MLARAVEVRLRGVSVEMPIHGAAPQSLKATLLRRAVGGRLAASGRGLTVRALADIDLDARDGDRIGIVGPNGAGKTSLLRLLAGVYPPTAGSVRVSGRISPILNLSLGMSIDATGFENIRLCGALWGLSRREIDAGIDDIAVFTELGPYLSVPVRTYSAGMLMRLSFAIATLGRPEILLIDEVLGVGDAGFVVKAQARLTRFAGHSRILFVSAHAPALLRTFCDKVLWLNEGRVAAFGAAADVLEAYDAAVRRNLAAGNEAVAALEAEAPWAG